MNTTATWTINGRNHTFSIHKIGQTYRAIPGIYLFCRVHEGYWFVSYAGQSGDLHDRLTRRLQQHHALPCVIADGATHIATMHFTGTEAQRIALETEFRIALDPPCNRQ